MRIAFITTSFPLFDRSTSGVFVEKLANHISREVEMSVIVPSSNVQQKISYTKPYSINRFRYAPRAWELLAHQPGGIPVAFKKNRLLILLLPGFFISMAASVIRIVGRTDLIHANWAITGAIAGIIGVLTRTPVITTLRGSDVSRGKNSWADRFILRLCLKTNHKIITVCPPLAANIKEDFPWASRKIISIQNGVDNSFLKLKKEYSDDGVYRIISIGSLIPRKNMAVIIRAVGKLDDMPDIVIEIIGSGLELKSLRRLGDELGLGDKLLMTGSVPANEIAEHLSKADIFVLASYSEGRPNVVVEALASGLPVIASNIEGITDMIQNNVNGLLFSPDDADALSKKIRHALKNPDFRKKIAEEGRNYVVENNLNWKSCAKEYLDVYKNIIKE